MHTRVKTHSFIIEGENAFTRRGEEVLEHLLVLSKL